VGDAAVGASVLSYKPRSGEDGYFMLLVSPEIKSSQDKPLPKTVVFVVDRSGSMSGKKIEQAKGALRFVLNNLREGDLFNVVAYDNSVESFAPELQRFDDSSRKAALGFVEGLYAGGSTNIDGALQAALAQLQDDSRPNYIVFLTDGLPTVGERNEAKIADIARQRNKVRARVFTFGVGYDVNSRLLDNLARVCFGQSHYVRPNEDIEVHVSQLYARIGAPVMTNVKLVFDREDFPAERGGLVNRMYPREVHDLFAGDQLVLVGRYKKGGLAKVTISGSVGGSARELHFPVTLVDQSHDETLAFAEKLWAMRRVGEIIDQIDVHGKNQELVDELVMLSKQHGILTPYTAFLADENSSWQELAEQRRRAGVALDSLHEAEGLSGFVQRDLKLQLQKSNRAAAPSAAGGYGGGGFGVDASGRGGLGGLGAPDNFDAARTRFATPSAPQAGGMPALRTLADDAPVEVTNVKQVGAKTFYRRGERWVDSALTETLEKSLKKVERFSREYFQLLNRFGKDMAKYAATDEEIVIVLDGQAYAF
jgi:Ca-activated chloride channel family protein